MLIVLMSITKHDVASKYFHDVIRSLNNRRLSFGPNKHRLLPDKFIKIFLFLFFIAVRSEEAIETVDEFLLSYDGYSNISIYARLAFPIINFYWSEM